MAETDPAPSRESRMDVITAQAFESFSETKDDRLREVMQSLVSHLHGFIREVGLTTKEWTAAIEFLTQVGHLTDEKRQEFILLSDVLGASMLTVAQNSSSDPKATESTVFGPFFHDGSPEISQGHDLANGAPGTPCFVNVSVSDGDGDLVVGGRVEVWGADDDGLYDVQYEGDRTANRGHLFTNDSGMVSFWTVLPTAYAIPTDGPVGSLLRATSRSPMRPAHLHFKVSADGYRTLVTHLFVDGDPYLENDAVFGVRPSLVVDFTRRGGDDPAPDGSVHRGGWYEMNYDFVLAKEGA